MSWQVRPGAVTRVVLCVLIISGGTVTQHFFGYATTYAITTLGFGAGIGMAPHAMASAAGIVLIPKLFPPLVRTSGLSIAYALGATLFGGTAQVVFTWIINATGDKLSWVWYIITMSFVSLIATALIRVPRAWSGHAPAASVKVKS